MTHVLQIALSGGAGSSPPPPLEARIAALAARQGGAVSRKQLMALGLSSAGISARVRRGLLHRLHAGVYAVGHPVVHGAGLDHAALLACGPGAVLAARSAAHAWDLRAWSSRSVEVIAGRGRRSRPGLVVHHHRLHPDDVTVRDGLPLTTVARTLFDLAEVLRLEHHERAWQQGLRLRLVDPGAVRAVAARNPGRHALKVVLPLLEHPGVAGVAETRSAFEADFALFASERLADFPPPQLNAWVRGFEVDATWRQPRVTVELDSREFHDNSPAFERDRAKWNALVAAGEVVFPLTARRLRLEPELVAAQLRAVLRERWPR